MPTHIEIVVAAEEINLACIFKDDIVIEGATDADIVRELRECDQVDKNDSLSKTTFRVLRELGVKIRGRDERMIRAGAPPVQKESAVSKQPQKAGAVGITDVVLDLLLHNKGGYTKPEILAVLAQKFPERATYSMKNTVNCLVPTKLNQKYPTLGVRRHASGRYYVTGKLENA
jgi:hypothetical protein